MQNWCNFSVKFNKQHIFVTNLLEMSTTEKTSLPSMVYFGNYRKPYIACISIYYISNFEIPGFFDFVKDFIKNFIKVFSQAFAFTMCTWVFIFFL